MEVGDSVVSYDSSSYISSGSGSGGRRYFLSYGGIIVDEESRETGETGGGLVAAGSEGTRSPLSIPSEIVAAPGSPCGSSGSGACGTGCELLICGGVTAGGGCLEAGGGGRKRASCRGGFIDGSKDGGSGVAGFEGRSAGPGVFDREWKTGGYRKSIWMKRKFRLDCGVKFQSGGGKNGMKGPLK